MSFAGGASGPIASAFVEVTANTDSAIRSILSIGRAFAGVEAEADAAAKAVANAFDHAADSANRSLRGIGGAATFGELEAESAVAGEAVGENIEGGSHRGAAALGFLKTGIVALGAALGAGAVAMVGFGLKSAASLEQTRISFTALLGSAQEADGFIRQMQDFAAKTPFEFAGLADNARALLATAGALKITRDQIIPTIGTIGDLVSVLGAPPEAIDRVITAFSQMASKGKASTEEVMQLAEALPGFPVFDAMAKGLGISTAALQDQLSKGLIPADKGVQALIKGMKEFPGAAGAMAQQAETLNGLFSTFKDTISLTLTDRRRA
jgi:tape measure domain-containing protein